MENEKLFLQILEKISDSLESINDKLDIMAESSYQLKKLDSINDELSNIAIIVKRMN